MTMEQNPHDYGAKTGLYVETVESRIPLSTGLSRKSLQHAVMI